MNNITQFGPFDMNCHKAILATFPPSPKISPFSLSYTFLGVLGVKMHKMTGVPKN